MRRRSVIYLQIDKLANLSFRKTLQYRSSETGFVPKHTSRNTFAQLSRSLGPCRMAHPAGFPPRKGGGLTVYFSNPPTTQPGWISPEAARPELPTKTTVTVAAPAAPITVAAPAVPITLTAPIVPTAPTMPAASAALVTSAVPLLHSLPQPLRPLPHLWPPTSSSGLERTVVVGKVRL